MRTVSGTAISSEPATLSGAIKSLSQFIDSENGASDAMSAYLRRTLASLKELKHLYKGLSKSSSAAAASPSGKKRKRRKSDVAGDNDAPQSEPSRKKHRR